MALSTQNSDPFHHVFGARDYDGHYEDSIEQRQHEDEQTSCMKEQEGADHSQLDKRIGFPKPCRSELAEPSNEKDHARAD